MIDTSIYFCVGLSVLCTFAYLNIHMLWLMWLETWTIGMLIYSKNKQDTMISFRLFCIFIFVIHSCCVMHYSSSTNGMPECAPLGTACFDFGLAHYYSLFHFNGRYIGDERMRVPFAIAINAPEPWMLWLC